MASDPLLARLRRFKSRVAAKRDDPPWSTRRLSMSFTSPPRFVSALAEEDADQSECFERGDCDPVENSVIVPTSGWKTESGRSFPPRVTSQTAVAPEVPYAIEKCDEEEYRSHFYEAEHWNFYVDDPEIGPVVLSLKQEATISREHFRVLVRAPSHFVHGLLPASCLSANRYNLDDVVAALGHELDLIKPLKRVQLSSFGDELLKLDQSFVVSDHKVGVVYVKEGQTREDEILGNLAGSQRFDDFLRLLGKRVDLTGFRGYRGGLDINFGMTGETSVYEEWAGHRVMFHVSTLLPGGDEQQVQRKRHIGNDLVCVVFVDGAETVFDPMAIRSHFLHSYIVVQCEDDEREGIRYRVSAVSRDGVPLCKPHLSNQDTFFHDSVFHDFLLAKIINAERACFRAPKFAELQNRTQLQMMQNMIIAAEDAEMALKEGKNVKTAVGRRGSWLPVGFVRPPSPLVDVNREKIESFDQLSTDLKAAYQNKDISDVICLIGKNEIPLYGIKAILAARSKIFKSLLCNAAPAHPRRSSITRMQSQKKERSMLRKIQLTSIPPNVDEDDDNEVGSSSLSRSLRKPSATGKEKKTKKNSSSSGGMKEKIKMKFQRGFSKGSLDKVAVEVATAAVAVETPAKIVAGKYLVHFPQFDFNEFDVVMEYLHTGCCSLSPATLSGVVCIAEYLELSDLEQACFEIIHGSVDFKIIWDLLKRLGHYFHFQSACSMFEKVVEFVDDNAREFLLSPSIKDLPRNVFEKIIRRPLKVPEIVKFKTCLLWGNENCSPSTWKEDVSQLVKDLDYYKVSPVDLIKIVVPSDTVDKDRVMLALAYHADPKSMEPLTPTQLDGAKKTTTTLCGGSSSREHSIEPNDSGIDATSIGSHASISGLGNRNSLRKKRGGGGARSSASDDLVVLPIDTKEDSTIDHLTHL